MNRTLKRPISQWWLGRETGQLAQKKTPTAPQRTPQHEKRWFCRDPARMALNNTSGMPDSFSCPAECWHTVVLKLAALCRASDSKLSSPSLSPPWRGWQTWGWTQGRASPSVPSQKWSPVGTRELDAGVTLCWRRKTSRKGTGEGNSLIRCRQLNLWSVRKGVREPGNNKGKLNALQVVGNRPSLLTSGIVLGSWDAGRLLVLPCPLPCQVFEGRLGDIIYTGDVTELRQMVTISSVEELEGGMDWDAGNRHHLSWTVKAEKFWKCLFSVAWGWENPARTEKHRLP